MRKSFVLGAALSVALSGLFATEASAQAPQCNNAGPFCIDGVLPDQNAGPVTNDPFGSGQAGQELGPKNSNTTKIGVINHAAVPMLAFTNPNAQVDLRSAYIRGAQDPLTGDVWLYFAWTRDSDSGSGFISLETQKGDLTPPCTYPITTVGQCNPWSDRAVGDQLFSWDQQGNSRDVYYRVYSTAGNGGFVNPVPCPGTVEDLGCLLDPNVARAEYTADGFGGELAINLSSFLDIDPNVCTVFGNVIPGTVTGNSDTADYKDVILAPLSVQLCGVLKIQKVTQDQAGNPFPDTQSIFQYLVDGATVDRGPSPIKNGETKTESDLPPGSYTVTEPTVAVGYTLFSIVCTGVTGGTVQLAAGEEKTCVITNRLNPNNPNGLTLPFVSLRDSITVSPLVRVTGDSAAQFVVTFRLYASEADCAADTARTGGEAFGPMLMTLTVENGVTVGRAETHVLGTGVQKAFKTEPYAWWARFPGNTVNGLPINTEAVSTCNAEKVRVERVITP